MFLFHPSCLKTKTPLRRHKTVSGVFPVLAAGSLLIALPLAPAHAQYSETEQNNTKATANVINLGTATSATISGTSANSGDLDYFRINTSYQTPGIYRNQIQLNNPTQLFGTLRGQTQTSGTINQGTDFAVQTSTTSGTPMPYGFNQYYSFGGAGQTQSMNYRVAGTGTSTGGSYTATFSSSVITPTDIGTINPGNITFSALANIGSSGVSTDTSIVILDSNYNVYYDNVAGSTTNGQAASNNSPAAGTNGFNLKRRFSTGTYYIMIGINNLATNQPAASDDTTRSNLVLDFDNVAATGNTFYNGNNGNTRPSDFQVTNAAGGVTYTSSGQVIPSLYALNFYKFTVAGAELPEPGSIALIAAGGPILFLLANRRRNRRK